MIKWWDAVLTELCAVYADVLKGIGEGLLDVVVFIGFMYV